MRENVLRSDIEITVNQIIWNKLIPHFLIDRMLIFRHDCACTEKKI